ncbi:Receptor-like kinase [Quillaja saponaria]|uniref:Receptor-like kinase n=1 Tax=Quillaja saponaria TaxID=32244 RepID=A0AAD7LNS1_QUISA|nr:Receptor-like kinase [Quillaja saponaria]KAJ7961574.1 Receptor-like kinase [Quillaja saponaria]
MITCCSFSILLMVFTLVLFKLGEAQYKCRESMCGNISIRFPFQIKGSNPDQDHCGYPYPGFYLSCTRQNETVFELPASSSSSHVDIAKFFITSVDYQSQEIRLRDPENCVPRQFLKLFNSSIITPFQFLPAGPPDYNSNVSFLNCSRQNGLDKFFSNCPIQVVSSLADLILYAKTMDFVCTKILDIYLGSHGFDLQNDLFLRWLKPNCSTCEAQEKKCKLKKNDVSHEFEGEETECFGPNKKAHISTIFLTTGVIIGSILLVLVIVVAFHIYGFYKMKEEDEARVEKFLEDYRALKPTRFSYADIKRITGQFKDKLGEGAHGTVFIGKLSNENEIHHVAVKILNKEWERDGQEFINEVRTMGKIHHVNVVRLVGYCADGSIHALVYDFLSNGSLQKFISSPDNKDSFLGWDKLLEIALGIAKGIDYLHQGCDQRILHFDIKPHNVLLDQNFIPKISDFGLAKLCCKDQSIVSLTAARGTLGYIAPEVFSRNFGNVSYKSDVYSYGMLLLEMVGGRKNTQVIKEESFQVLYPEWIHNILANDQDIHIHFEDEGDSKIAKKLAIVGLWCIQWHPADRPSMKVVMQMLEAQADKLPVPLNPVDSTSYSTRTSASVLQKRLNLELEVIEELE